MRSLALARDPTPRGAMGSLVLAPEIPQDPVRFRAISLEGGWEVTINPVGLHGSWHRDFHGIPHDIPDIHSESTACMCNLHNSIEPVNAVPSLSQRGVPRHALPPVSSHDPT